MTSTHSTKVIPKVDEADLPEISGWGHYPLVHAEERLGEDLESITNGVVLTRGLGRSYGDASLPPHSGKPVAGSVLADRILAFDPESGIVRVEAGFPLWRLNRLFLPRNWFTPVTPGTHFVTLGGMVAADVHGKMHHVEGCVGEHITRLLMHVADGRIVECSETRESELFRATIGGMGLTGHILEVDLRMKRIPSPWMWQETERCDTFDHLLDALQEAGKTWPFTVTWADFLEHGPRMGRGLLMKARWAEPREAPHEPPRFRNALALPPIFPSWLGQPFMVKIFNRLVFAATRPSRGILHPEMCFYPLDIMHNWNNLYGKRGFTQYQCVLPDDPGHAAQHRFVEVLRRLRAPVFLTVIKDCGREGRGMLSFPKPGISYALDLPIDDRTQSIVDALNELVVAEGGRVYLAKDAFTRAEHFRAMESDRLEAFQAVRRKWDPQGSLRSAQSVRLFGDRP